MKRVLSAIALSTMVVFLALPKTTLAASSDTLVVYANGPYLNVVINGDTTSTGQQAHSVYKLVSLDTTYVFLGQIKPKSNITVIGQLGTDGRPPCIQPGVLNDGSIPQILFDLTVKGQVANFDNLYIEDLSTNGSYNHPNRDILVSADSVKLNLNNDVFDYNHGNVVGYTGNWVDIHVTNCKFTNGVDPSVWTDAEIIAPLWPATPAVDTISFKYNTLFCDNAYAIVAKPPVKYIDFDHNSVIFTFLQPFFIFSAHTAKIDNNIFYGAFMGGETKAEYPWWDEEFSPAPPSLIDLDTMDVKSDSVWDKADIGKANLRMLAEGTRQVQVENNLFYEPKAITDFWSTWDKDSAATKDSLYTPSWMNSRTQHMFNDKTDWPGFTASGNMMNVDPGYGASFANVLQGGGAYGLGLLNYFTKIRSSESPTTGWGYQLPQISGSNWIPAWPLPEAADMKYSNASLMTAGTDNKPLGDPGWFTGGVTGVQQQHATTPTKFALSNNYPNPFNPTTVVKVTLNKSGVMSLKVYNVLGQLVKVVAQGYRAPGVYTYNINMDSFASGVYFYRLRQGANVVSKKMILLK